MLIIPALGRKRGEVSEFKVSLSCVLRPSFKRGKKKVWERRKKEVFVLAHLIQQLLMFGFIFSILYG